MVWTKRFFHRKTHIPTSHGHSSAVVDDKILFVCLFESDSIHDPSQLKALIYDPKTDVWSEKQGIEIECGSGLAAVGATLGNHTPKAVYVFGCRYLGSSPMNLYTWIYDSVTGTWSMPKLVPADIGVNGVAVVDDVFYVFGTYYVEITMQYVPIGYRSSVYTTTPTPSNSVTTSESEPSKYSSTYLIVVALSLTVGVAVSLFFYFKNRKRKNT